jgi:hypothetical protein
LDLAAARWMEMVCDLRHLRLQCKCNNIT